MSGYLTSVLLVACCLGQCCAYTQSIAFTQFDPSGNGEKRIHSLYRTRLQLRMDSEGEHNRCVSFAHDPPYLAVITEPDACNSEERMNQTVRAISSAVSTGKVSLVSVRVEPPRHIECSRGELEGRIIKLTSKLVSLSSSLPFRVVVTSDWVDAAIQSLAHGIHVKERDRSRIPDIRKAFFPRTPIIGTSAHSVSSALEATSLCQPDYLFVGTCYATQSHPDKVQLEGPDLPGTVCRSLASLESKQLPVVFGIGGIDEDNCAIVVLEYGADGIAAIRSILQSTNPCETVERMHTNMRVPIS